MAKTISKVLVPLVVAMLLITLVEGSMATSVCNIDSRKLKFCRPAVRGRSPPPPTKQCCAVMRGTNLSCLCRYKNVLPALGINPTNALALPKKCGLRTPPECRVA